MQQRLQTAPLPPITRLWDDNAAGPEHDGNGWPPTSATTPGSCSNPTRNAMSNPCRWSRANPPLTTGTPPRWSSSITYDVPFTAAVGVTIPALAAPTRGATTYGPCDPPTPLPHRRSSTGMRWSSVSTEIWNGRFASQLPWFPSSS